MALHVERASHPSKRYITRKIIQAPDPILFQKAKPVERIDESTRELIADMKRTLIRSHGVGLAAPQVGESLQIFIVKQSRRSPFYTFINPDLTLLTGINTPKGKKRIEGCLSERNFIGTTRRANTVSLSWTDEAGIRQHSTISGYGATIIQHEYDHLQGILFLQRMKESHGNLFYLPPFTNTLFALGIPLFAVADIGKHFNSLDAGLIAGGLAAMIEVSIKISNLYKDRIAIRRIKS